MLASFAPRVTRIVDHHQKMSPSLVAVDMVSSVLEMTGSCATLIAREILMDKSYVIEELIKRALVSVILFDTGNLKAKGRFTSTDSEIVRDLVKTLPSSFDRNEQFSKYFSACFDVSNLTVRQVLEKDYKEFTFGDRYVIGFSSITTLLSEYLSRSESKRDLPEFFSGHNLDAFILFGVSIPYPKNGQIRKQIAIYQPEGTQSEFTDSLVMMFEASEELKCVRLEGVGVFDGVVLDQGNVDLSRKHIIPLLTSFITSV